jgi:hypothetical protein
MLHGLSSGAETIWLAPGAVWIGQIGLHAFLPGLAALQESGSQDNFRWQRALRWLPALKCLFDPGRRSRPSLKVRVGQDIL